MGLTFDGFLFFLMLGAILFVVGAWVYYGGYDNASEELGQAICEEEYGMDFEDYYGETLYCKPMAQTEQYDGIEVEINNGLTPERGGN